MNITRALAEIKLLGKRIDKQVGNINFVSYAKSGSDCLMNRGIKKKDFKQEAKADLQSITDLIGRRTLIKSAIAISNANTTIKVADGEYTVTEAITRKNNIEAEMELVDTLKYQLINAENKVEDLNRNVEASLQSILETLASKDNAKSLSEESAKMREQYMKDNEYSLVEGMDDARNLIERMEEEIDTFMFEVDFALSQSNTLTEIDII